MSSRRQERVSERIHVEISELLHKQLRDPRLAQVTVTGVEITPDLKLATVFISVMGNNEAGKAALQGMERASGFLRHELAVSLGMRFTPTLRFALDQSWERGSRIDQLLERLPSPAEAGRTPGTAASPAEAPSQRDGRRVPSGRDGRRVRQPIRQPTGRTPSPVGAGWSTYTAASPAPSDDEADSEEHSGDE